jgi:hypothetical protein
MASNNPQDYRSYTLPPPVGGLNYSDPIDNIPQADARRMLNVFPDSDAAKLRSGCESFLEVSAGDTIKRLYNLPLADGTEKLIACVNNELQEIGSGSASDVTNGSTTPTSDEWQGVVLKNRLFLVNGADAPQVYTGSSTFSDAGFTGSGLTASDAINISAYRGRIYLTEKDTASVWYTNTVGAVTGATTELDLSDVFTKGGYLVGTASFTNPNGDTAQDLFCAVSSEGQVLLYTGSYPGDSGWAIVAKYDIAKPIGYRCLIPYDSDLLIITRRGLIPVSSLFQNDEIGLRGVGRKINSLIRQAAASRASFDGWHGLYSPDQRKLFINMPIDNTTSEQLVCNVDSGAWCLYSYGSSNPYALSNFGSDIYFGAPDGSAYKAETGQTDDGESILVDLQWAWNDFGARGQYKRFVDARPLIVGSVIENIGIKIETDYEITGNATVTVTGSGSTPWGSPWGSPWSGTTRTNFTRYGLANQGHAGALRIFGSFSNAEVAFNTTEVRYQVGGQI